MSEWYTPSAGAWTLHMQRELGSTTLAAVRVVRHAPCRDMDTGWRWQKPYVSDLAAVSSQSEPNGTQLSPQGILWLNKMPHNTRRLTTNAPRTFVGGVDQCTVLRDPSP
jgi:hypothetical protein